MPTYDELQKQIEELQKQANEEKKKEKTETIADMKVKIAKYSITAAELGFAIGTARNGRASSKKAPGEPKYRNPENNDDTWTGKGPMPRWLKDAIESGKEKENFLITQ
ncbi:H-NS histone family protein [Burkholderia sp. BE17]|uniref:H-NS histone family protein n=1 Tax=Burkholderia sp. BE17 TaxID=2656644 RepID=UPI001406B191|nr:H-NS histone family protein [Burkholderia sp. BE17]MPV71513.1 H-NS histone family protein [Burkholderia sp. BE17]